MVTTAAKTTIDFKGKTYPYYRTIRGQYDFENAGFRNEAMAEGKASALYAYIFFQLRDCAKRAGTPILLSLDEFIDQADGEDLLSVYGRLVTEEKRLREPEDSAKKKEVVQIQKPRNEA